MLKIRFLIDVAAPANKKKSLKTFVRLRKYNDLGTEISGMRNLTETLLSAIEAL